MVKLKVTRTDGVVIEAEGEVADVVRLGIVPWQFMIQNVAAGGGLPYVAPLEAGRWTLPPLGPGEHVLPDGTKITIYF